MDTIGLPVRVYNRNGHTVKIFSRKVLYIETVLMEDPTFTPDLLMYVYHSDARVVAYYAPIEPNADGTNRTVTLRFPFQKFKLTIEQAIDNGFDFSLLPNPTKDEIECTK